MEWMGKHALMIYILAACNILPVLLQGFYWRRPENNIVFSLFSTYEIYWRLQCVLSTAFVIDLQLSVHSFG